MEARATLSNVRISPRKVQIVLDLIRNKPADVALATLRLTPKAASPILEKLVKSAIANADHNHSMDKDRLYVAECYVAPGAQGRAYRILKRTSHITVVLREQD